MPFGVVTCTLSDNLSQNTCILSMYVCMYITASASISSTAFEVWDLSFAVNRFRKKTKEHSERIKCDVENFKRLRNPVFRIESHVFACEEYECKWR